MFAKPINLVSLYIICCLNLIFISTPFLAIIYPLISLTKASNLLSSYFSSKILGLFLITVFLVFALMLFYLFLDFLFGFSVNFSLKKCQRYEKNKEFDFLTPVLNQIKEKFNEPSLSLYIKNTSEINAYAVASLGSKSIIITKGLIDHYLVLCPEPKMFLSTIRSLLAHEMSHLINKDFLPAFVIIANQRATNLVNKIIKNVFNYLKIFLNFIFKNNKKPSIFLGSCYNKLNKFLNFFNSFCVYNFYEFIRKFSFKNVEFRSDIQSSKAFGGANMVKALSLIDEDGYFTIFSTHSQSKIRIEKIKNIKISDELIKANFSDKILNYFSLFLIIITTLYFAKIAKIDLILRAFIRKHEILHHKLSFLWNLIQKIY
jgi:hypothetical protein